MSPKYKVGDIVTLHKFECYPHWCKDMNEYEEQKDTILKVIEPSIHCSEYTYRFKNNLYTWPESALTCEDEKRPSYFGDSVTTALRRFEEILDRNLKNLKNVRKL